MFITVNQFDKQFDVYQKFKKDRSVCPLFSLISSVNFLETGDITQTQHELNLKQAISTYESQDLPKYLSFDELSQLSEGKWKITKSSIVATTPELVVTGVIGFQEFFPDFKKKYATIFLKNTNFFVVLVNPETSTYAVRDCHLNEQVNFSDYMDLMDYLNKIYRFDEQTIVDGLHIPEYDNIEFTILSSE